MKLNRKSSFIIITVIACSLVMSGVDAFFNLPYILRSLMKILMFLLVPMIYFVIHREEFPKMKKLFIPQKKELKLALLLGLGVYFVIMAAYFLFRNFIDFSGIRESLMSGVGVNAENFVFVAVYISFVNSLLEEFFFRGYAFILLKNEIKPVFAYGFSAFLFAFYHVGMTVSWFSPVIYLLAMLGLLIGGVIFSFLNDRCENIYPSWLVHMCANFAINTVGFLLFGIL